MAGDVGGRPAITAHGAEWLPAVTVESYNVEVKDDEGFIGDRASKGAFRRFIEEWRKPLRDIDQDPFGDEQSQEISKKRLDDLLVSGDREAAGILQGAIEGFAQELALVTRRFLKLKGWKDAERLVIGGGFSGSRVGELAIGRASVRRGWRSTPGNCERHLDHDPVELAEHRLCEGLRATTPIASCSHCAGAEVVIPLSRSRSHLATRALF